MGKSSPNRGGNKKSLKPAPRKVNVQYPRSGGPRVNSRLHKGGCWTCWSWWNYWPLMLSYPVEVYVGSWVNILYVSRHGIYNLYRNTLLTKLLTPGKLILGILKIDPSKQGEFQTWKSSLLGDPLYTPTGKLRWNPQVMEVWSRWLSELQLGDFEVPSR